MTRRAGRTFLRGVLGLLVVIAACWGTLLAAVPAPAGDPVLVAASPGDDETVKSPDELRLTFDRPVAAGLATVLMNNPTGEQVVAGRPYNPPGAPDVVAVAMPRTRYAGTYAVVWSVPSSRPEPVAGAFRFQVYAPGGLVPDPEIAAAPDPVVDGLHTVARAASTVALVLGVGVAFVLALVWPEGTGTRPARRLLGWSWAALVATTLLTIATYGGYTARVPLTEVLDPALLGATPAAAVGAALYVRLLVLVPVTVGLVLLVTRAPAGTGAGRWTRAGAVLVAAGALAATWSFSRPHDPSQLGLLTVGADVALLLAVAVAVGGPVVLWLVLRGAVDPASSTAVARLGRLMPVSGVLLVAAAATFVGGWPGAALGGLGVLVAGTGLAAFVWLRRQNRGDREVGEDREEDEDSADSADSADDADDEDAADGAEDVAGPSESESESESAESSEPAAGEPAQLVR